MKEELQELVSQSKIKTPFEFNITWENYIGLAMAQTGFGTVDDGDRLDIYDTSNSLHILMGQDVHNFEVFLKEVYDNKKLGTEALTNGDEKSYSHIIGLLEEYKVA